MDGPMSGDIFPARESIGLINQVDLGVPLEIPPVPPEAEPDHVPASREAVCAFMKQNPLRKVYHSLRLGIHEITVDAELAARARVPIERLLQIR